MTRIKAGDILYLPFKPSVEHREHEHVFEVGPGKFRSEEGFVYYEAYPIAKKPNCETEFTYLTDPIWIEKKEIGEHYTVRNAEDFHYAWVSLGYEVCIDGSHITFRKLFDYEPVVDNTCVESLSSLSDDEDDEIRSVDSYSTTGGDSEDSDCSFVTYTEEPCTECTNNGDCAICKDLKETNRWFDREWIPDEDSDEFKIKSVIQRIENKYT